jgi:hypothetical protein
MVLSPSGDAPAIVRFLELLRSAVSLAEFAASEEREGHGKEAKAALVQARQRYHVARKSLSESDNFSEEQKLEFQFELTSLQRTLAKLRTQIGR